MKRSLIATDMDRTLIYTRDAFELADPESVALTCVEYLNATALSFITEKAARRLSDIVDTAVLVPTTTRTIAQFKRVQLPCGETQFAITSNGGNILTSGVPDRAWRAAIDTAVRASAASLDEVTRELRARIAEDWVRKFRIAEDLFCYLVVEPELVPPDFLAEWQTWCGPRGWSVSRQSRKIYAIPQAVNKNKALSEVRARAVAAGILDADAVTLAAGDGVLDSDVLAAADAAIRPRHGELELLGWDRPHLTVTAAAGIRAGECIVDWFAAGGRLVQ